MLIASRKIGQWGDPLTLPKSRSECAKWATANLPFGKKIKTCVGWKVQWSHLEVEGFLDFYGPDDLAEDAKQAAAECAAAAIATAIGTTIATEGAGAAAAVAAAEEAFIGCMKQKVQDEAGKFSVKYRADTHWTDWS
ncbi:hypothetical protein [Mycetohabitans endofungorum]|uniref:hypothetical protein n=1 Tax=Mycetohabitans endofungorum TaxID=417203 RepID=UPI002B059B63|nr:hypothetical protein [Mycetohabitans endofungorum]